MERSMGREGFSRYPHRGHDIFDVFRSGQYNERDLDLHRLQDLENWTIAEGEQDIRGWTIVGRDDQDLGQVENLIASPKTREVYFLVAQVGGVLGMGGKHVLVPLDHAQLDIDNQRVFVDTTREGLENAVEFSTRGRVDYLDAYRYWSEGRMGMHEERREMAGMRGGEAPEEHRTTTGERETTIPLREEEIVARREVHTGEVEVEKHVETEQRTVDVPVTHTEVEIERRPVTGEERYRTQGEISESEVRIPVMEEETHIEKRPVVKEEIVIRQHPETKVERHTETVRREVAEIHKEGDVDVDVEGKSDIEEHRR